MSRDAWTTLDLTRPSAHLRELAALSLAEAATLLGMAGPTSVHTAERREAGKGLAGAAPGTATLATILARAAAYGLTIEVRVRRQR